MRCDTRASGLLRDLYGTSLRSILYRCLYRAISRWRRLFSSQPLIRRTTDCNLNLFVVIKLIIREMQRFFLFEYCDEAKNLFETISYNDWITIVCETHQYLDSLSCDTSYSYQFTIAMLIASKYIAVYIYVLFLLSNKMILRMRYAITFECSNELDERIILESDIPHPGHVNQLKWDCITAFGVIPQFCDPLSLRHNLCRRWRYVARGPRHIAQRKVSQVVDGVISMTQRGASCPDEAV